MNDRFYIITLTWSDHSGVNVRTAHGLAEDCGNATEEEIFSRIFADRCALYGAPAATAISYYYLAENRPPQVVRP